MSATKSITLSELAKEVGGELIGNGKLSVNNIRDVEEAQEGDLAFVLKKKFEFLLESTKATCALVPLQISKASIPIIKCKNPNLAFKKAAQAILKDRIHTQKGIHKAACIGKGAKLGKNLSIGALCVLEDNVEIGDDSIIYPNVTIRTGTTIGKKAIIHPGVVIGADGFGYELTERGHEKIPQVGGVIIEDDVEIGACTTIDKGKISNTKIGQGTKIDNLVQIAHNVTIGKNCVIAAQCGISGSVKIGNNVMMGGQVGIADHLTVGDNVMLAAQAALMKSVPSNTIMWGKPARPFKKAKEIYALFDKLPDIYKRLKILEDKIK